MQLDTTTLRAALAAFTVLTASASAQLHTDLTEPVEALYVDGTEGSLQWYVSNGYRITDIEVWDSYAPSYYAALVRNEGAYAKTWDLLEGLTPAQVQARANANVRITDIERYWDGSDYRWSILEMANAGDDHVTNHGFGHNFTAAQVDSFFTNNPGLRMLDLEAYEYGGTWCYAFIYVDEDGVDWSYALDASPTELESQLQQGYRILDIERRDAAGNRAVIVVADDGKKTRLTHGEDAGSTQLPEQYASRIIDFDLYRDGNGELKQEFVLRPNADDVTWETSEAMRAPLNQGQRSGFMISNLDLPGWDGPSVNKLQNFEAGMLSTVAHHLYALGMIAVENDELDAPVVEYTGTTNGCPDGTNPVEFTLEEVLRRMMQDGKATAAQAILDRYGSQAIEDAAVGFGAFGTDIVDAIGCPCSGVEQDAISLRGLAALFQAMHDGALGDERETFVELMNEVDEFGMGTASALAALDEELQASSLFHMDQTAFRNRVHVAHQRGATTCNGGTSDRSVGLLVTLDYRESCQFVERSFFLGAWAEDIHSASAAEAAVGDGIVHLFRRLVRDAIESWEDGSQCIQMEDYGTSTINSSGLRGQILGWGSHYIEANDLAIGAQNLPPNRFGYLLVSPAEGFVANPAGSAGNLLLGGPIGRYSTQIQNSGSTGTFHLPIDLGAMPTPGGPRPAESGETLHFQWWYRDVDATGGPTSNFTNGLRVHVL